jgi:restriction endonuclease S subunit
MVTLKRGKDLTKSQFNNGKVPVAGSNGVIGFHDIANYSGPGVTVGRSGSCGMVQFFENNFWAHNTVLVVDDFKGNDPKFISYYLKFLRLEQYATGASVPTLNRNLFSNIKVNDIPLNEQQKIAHVLFLLEKAIQKQDTLISTTESLKKSLPYKLYTGGTKNDELKLSELGMIAKSWDVVKLGDVYDFTSKPRTIAIKDTEEVPFIPMTLISDQSFYAEKYYVKKGSSLTSGTYFEMNSVNLILPYRYSYADCSSVSLTCCKPFEHRIAKVPGSKN